MGEGEQGEWENGRMPACRSFSAGKGEVVHGVLE